MSTESGGPGASAAGYPELSPLGKRLEVLRIGRGISKQQLAKAAGTSRQQLWRVMTGKCDLTPALCLRVAQVLNVDARHLSDPSQWREPPRPGPARGRGGHNVELADIRSPRPDLPTSLAAYLADAAAIAATLATLPVGDDGRTAKRAVLNQLEELAASRGLPLSAAFFDLRRRVAAGDL